MPQDEVQWVPLAGVVGVPATLGCQHQHLVAPEPAHRTEGGEGGHLEEDGAVDLVGVAPVQHHPDEPSDVRDGRRGPGLAPALQDSEGFHVVVEPGRLGCGQVEVVDPQLAGLAEDVVVHVGDVADAAGLVAPVAQAALEDVVCEIGGGVTHVGGVVWSDATGVEGDHLRRLEGHHLTPGCVVEAHGRVAHELPSLEIHPAGPTRGQVRSSRPVKRTATRDL